MRSYYVYIMASKTGTLYIGVTNDLERRVWQHKNGTEDGFSKKYGCDRLVYFEEGGDIRSAIEREKQLKNWRREKKEALIRDLNPRWIDLAEQFWSRDSSTASSLASDDFARNDRKKTQG